MSEPNRIKPTYRSATPLPAPPKLSESLQHSVVTREDLNRIDAALQGWWTRFQSALEMNGQTQLPIDCGGAHLGRTRIQNRRGTAAAWTEFNPILSDGELGVETDTAKGKFGDGQTQWTSLAYSF